MLATITAAGLIALDPYSGYALVALLIGFCLMMAMFGTRMRQVLNE